MRNLFPTSIIVREPCMCVIDDVTNWVTNRIIINTNWQYRGASVQSNLTCKNLALLTGFECNLFIIQKWLTFHWATCI